MPRQLLFAKGFADIIRNGQKRITIRRGERNYKVGDVVVRKCKEGDQLRLEITDVRVSMLKFVLSDDLRDDGFVNADDAVYILSQWYKGISLDSTVTAIRFRYLGDA